MKLSPQVTEERFIEFFRLMRDFKTAVLDLTMPCLNGADLIRHMRSEKRLMRIPVMMSTAESRIKQLAAGFAAGATVLLPKPFTKLRLQNSLRMMLNTGPEVRKSRLPSAIIYVARTRACASCFPSRSLRAHRGSAAAEDPDQPAAANVSCSPVRLRASTGFSPA